MFVCSMFRGNFQFWVNRPYELLVKGRSIIMAFVKVRAINTTYDLINISIQHASSNLTNLQTCNGSKPTKC